MTFCGNCCSGSTVSEPCLQQFHRRTYFICFLVPKCLTMFCTKCSPYYVCVIFVGSVLISAMVCVLRIAFLVSSIISSCGVGASVTLSKDTVLMMQFSSTVSNVADTSLKEHRVFCSNPFIGTFAIIHAALVIFVGCP